MHYEYSNKDKYARAVAIAGADGDVQEEYVKLGGKVVEIDDSKHEAEVPKPAKKTKTK